MIPTAKGVILSPAEVAFLNATKTLLAEYAEQQVSAIGEQSALEGVCCISEVLRAHEEASADEEERKKCKLTTKT